MADFLGITKGGGIPYLQDTNQPINDFQNQYAKNYVEQQATDIGKDALITAGLTAVGVNPAAFALIKEIHNLAPEGGTGSIANVSKNVTMKQVVGNNAPAGYTKAQLAARTVKVNTAQVFLPMPQNINVQYPKNWSANSTSIQGDIAGADISKAVDQVQAELIRAGQNFAQGRGADRGVAQARYEAGANINDHMKLLFDNIPFREFTFDYTLQPKSAGEWTDIKKWIKKMKLWSAPIENGGTITWPNVFQMGFADFTRVPRGAEENVVGDAFNLFKTGALACTNVGVNYTPNGVWSQHAQGVPTAVQVSLSFTETELAFRDKIEAGW